MRVIATGLAVAAVVASSLLGAVTAFGNGQEANEAALRFANAGNYHAALDMFKRAIVRTCCVTSHTSYGSGFHLDRRLGFISTVVLWLWGRTRSAVTRTAVRSEALASCSAFPERHVSQKQPAYVSAVQELSPDEPDYVTNLGVTYMRLQDYPAARKAFNDALKVRPGLF